MTAPIHSDNQRDYILKLIAAGLTREQINEKAAEFEEPFGPLSPQLLYGYRKRYELELSELREERRSRIFTEGLALPENRAKSLLKLAAMLEEDLFEKKKRWLENVKGIGSGSDFERITFEEFNAAEIKELRALYDDIAKETGGRIQRKDITSAGQALKLYKDVSPDDWDTDDTPDLPDTSPATDE